jgi:hypothetical protein
MEKSTLDVLFFFFTEFTKESHQSNYSMRNLIEKIDRINFSITLFVWKMFRIICRNKLNVRWLIIIMF